MLQVNCVITSILNGCASRFSAQKRVNDLLDGLYNKAYLASHSLCGQAAKGKDVRPGLDKAVVEEIVGKLLFLIYMLL